MNRFFCAHNSVSRFVRVLVMGVVLVCAGGICCGAELTSTTGTKTIKDADDYILTTNVSIKLLEIENNSGKIVVDLQGNNLTITELRMGYYDIFTNFDGYVVFKDSVGVGSVEIGSINATAWNRKKTIEIQSPVTVTINTKLDSDTGGHGGSDAYLKIVGTGSLVIDGTIKGENYLNTSDIEANGSLSGTAIVASYTWTGATSTNWNVGSNWDSGSVPGVGATVIIPAVVTSPVSGAALSLKNLTVAENASLKLSSGALTVSDSLISEGDVDVAGSVTVEGSINSLGMLKSGSTISITGTSIISGTITSSGTQTYTGDVMLTGDTTLSAGTSNNIDFKGKVEGTGGSENLTITAKDALFTNNIGAVGNINITGNLGVNWTAVGVPAITCGNLIVSKNAMFRGAVSASSVEIDGEISFMDGSSITTSGTQEYGSAVLIEKDIEFKGTTVTFNGTVDTHSNGTSPKITITGNAVFGANVGYGKTVGDLTVSGTTTLNADVFFKAAGKKITFSKALDGDAAGRSLTAECQTITVSGLGITLPLKDINVKGALEVSSSASDGSIKCTDALSVSGNATVRGNVSAGSLSVTGVATIGERTASIDTGTGEQIYSNDVKINSTSGLEIKASKVTFSKKVNSYATSRNPNLTITAVETIFGGVVGDTYPLGALSVSGISTISGNVTTVGDQTYVGKVTLAGAATFSAIKDDDVKTVTFGISGITSSIAVGSYGITLKSNAVIYGENVFKALTIDNSLIGSSTTVQFEGGKFQKIGTISAKGNSAVNTLTLGSTDTNKWKVYFTTKPNAESFDFTKISNSESVSSDGLSSSELEITPAAANVVDAAPTGPSAVNWFVHKYYWVGKIDAKWSTVSNWAYDEEGTLPAPVPGFEDATAEITFKKVENGKDLELADETITVPAQLQLKKVSIEEDNRLGLAGYSLKVGSASRSFYNAGTIAIYGNQSGNVLESLSNGAIVQGPKSTIEYYGTCDGEDILCVTSSGTVKTYENLKITKTGNMTFNSSVNATSFEDVSAAKGVFKKNLKSISDVVLNGIWEFGDSTSAADAVKIEANLKNKGTITCVSEDVTITGKYSGASEFNASSKNTTFSGDADFSTGTFNHNSGTLLFNGSKLKVNDTVTTFYNLEIGANSSAENSFNIEENLIYNANFEAKGTVKFNGATQELSGTGTFKCGGLECSSTTGLTVKNDAICGQVKINSSSSLKLENINLSVSGDFSNEGNFDAGTSNVEFIGASDSVISGESTFYNLKCVAAGKTIKFAAGKTQSVSNNFTVKGTAVSPAEDYSKHITLISDSDGAAWNVDCTGAAVDLKYVKMKDSTNVTKVSSDPGADYKFLSAVYSWDDGNNVRWNFPGMLYTWTGEYSTEWTSYKNWTPKSVPGSGTKVEIPGGKTKYPVLISDVSIGDAGELTIGENATLTLNDKKITSKTISSQGTMYCSGGNFDVEEITNRTAGIIEISGGTLGKTKVTNRGKIISTGDFISAAAFNNSANGTITLTGKETLSGTKSNADGSTIIYESDSEITTASWGTEYNNLLISDATAISTELNVTGTTTVNAGSGAVTLSSAANTFTGAVSVSSAGAVSLNSDGSLKLTGADCSSLTVDNTASVSGTVITTGAQTYNGDVTFSDSLSANSGTTIDFNGSVDGAKVLTVTGNTTFKKAVGGTTALASISVTGTSDLKGGVVITTGIQTYNGAVTIEKDTTLTAKNGDTLSAITFNSTVSGAHDFTVDANVESAGDVTTSGKTQTYNGTVKFTADSTTLTAAEVILNGGTVTSTGIQTYNGVVTIGKDTTLTAKNGDTLSAITFNSTVSGAHDFTVDANVESAGDVTTSGKKQTYNGTVKFTAGSTTLTAAEVILNGGTVTSTGIQTYNGAVTIGKDTTLTAKNGDTLSITFNSTVSGAHDFTVDANVESAGDVTTSGKKQTYNGTVKFTASSTTLTAAEVILNGGTVTSTGIQTYNGAVTIGKDTTLTAKNGDTLSAITFNSTVSGAHDFTVDANVESAGNVTTSGKTQTYKGTFDFTNDLKLTAETVIFDGKVSGPHNLDVDAKVSITNPITYELNKITFEKKFTASTSRVTVTGDVEFMTANTFESLTLNKASSTCTFPTGDSNKQTIKTFTVTGGTGSGELINLVSKTPGTQWYICSSQTTPDFHVSYANIQDSYNCTLDSSKQPVYLKCENGNDAGNNDYWSFPGSTYIWNGEADSDWNNKANWSKNSVPGIDTIVEISTASEKTNPVLTASSRILDASPRKLKIDEASVLTLNSQSIAVTGTVDGSFTNYGMVISSGNETLTLSASGIENGTWKYVGGTVKPIVDVTSGTGKIAEYKNLWIAESANIYGDIIAESVEINSSSDVALTSTNGTKIAAPVTLVSNTTFENSTYEVQFTDVIDGACSLSLNGNGSVIFDSAVGLQEKLAALSVSGPSFVNGGSVSTTETQVYKGAMTLGAETQLNGTEVTLENNVSGPFNLTVNGLLKITENCASISTPAKVQTYNGDMTMTRSCSFTADSVVLNCSISASTNDLEVNAKTTFYKDLNISCGTVTFNGDVSGENAVIEGDVASTAATISFKNKSLNFVKDKTSVNCNAINVSDETVVTGKSLAVESGNMNVGICDFILSGLLSTAAGSSFVQTGTNSGVNEVCGIENNGSVTWDSGKAGGTLVLTGDVTGDNATSTRFNNKKITLTDNKLINGVVAAGEIVSTGTTVCGGELTIENSLAVNDSYKYKVSKINFAADSVINVAAGKTLSNGLALATTGMMNLTLGDDSIFVVDQDCPVTLGGAFVQTEAADSTAQALLYDGLVSSGTNTISFASDLYVAGNGGADSKIVLGGSTGNISAAKNVFVTAKNGSVELNSPLSVAQNIALLNGELKLDSIANVTSGKDVVMLNGSLSAITKDDVDTSAPYSEIEGLFAYYLVDRPCAVSLNAFPKALPDGVDVSGTDFTASVTGLSGQTITAGQNFYDNGVDLIGTSTWSLKLKENDNATSAFAELYNATVTNCSISATESAKTAYLSAAENCTDGGSNVNIFFSRPVIDVCQTIYDDVLKVSFKDSLTGAPIKIENSNNEVSAYSANIKNNAGSYTTFVDSECQVSTDGQGDLYVFYLKSPATWNTDATGLSAGAEQSTDFQGQHKTVVPYIDVKKAIKKAIAASYSGFRDVHKNRISHFTGDDRIATAEDKCKPVLVAVRTGQELHAATPSAQTPYDSHNFIEWQYSEPVSVGSTMDITDTTDASNLNQKATSTLGATSNGAKFAVAGLSEFASGKVESGKNNTSDYTVHALYRNFSQTAAGAPAYQTHRVRLGIAAYVDGTETVSGTAYQHWQGYIDSSKIPAGVVTPKASGIVYDAVGNEISDVNPDQYHVLPELSVISAETELYGAWDTSCPVFAPYKTFDPELDAINDSCEIIGASAVGGSTLNRIEFHVFDNDIYSDDSMPEWYSRIGWCKKDGSKDKTLYRSYSYGADIFGGARPFDSVDSMSARITSGGLRYSSLYNKAGFFKYSTGSNPTIAFSSANISSGGKSGMFFPLSGASRDAGVDDSLYFSVYLADATLPLKTTFTISYDQNACVTDLAGNRLKSTVVKSIDRVSPKFNISVAKISGDQLYIVFSKKLELGPVKITKTSGDTVEGIIADSLQFVTISGSAATKVEDLYIRDKDPKVVFQNEHYTGLVYTLNRNVTLDDIKNYYIQCYSKDGAIYNDPMAAVSNVGVSFIQDILHNYMSPNEVHALSDFAVDAVNPVYAYDDRLNSEGYNFSIDMYKDGSYAVHDWNAEQKNYGTLMSKRDVTFVSTVDSGDDEVECPQNVIMYLDNEPDSESVSKEYNKNSGYDWRVWIPSSAYDSGSSTPVEQIDPLSKATNDGTLALPGAWDEETGELKFELSAEDAASKGYKAGDQISFMFGLADSAMSPVRICHAPEYDEVTKKYDVTNKQPLFAMRLKNPEDITTVDLWSFRLKDIKLQRGNVTILNNVINAEVGETTTIRVNMPSDGNLNVAVMTLDGNIIQYLQHGRTTSGEHNYTWNGTTKSGKKVARGLYFVRVFGSGIDETRKVMVVKD